MVSCATVPKMEPVMLPAALEPMFGTCHGRDGAARLIVEGGDGIIQADAEWIAPAGGGWDVELANPIGQTLLSARFTKDAGVKVSGRFAEQIPALNVDEKGFLTLDGHFMGIRVDEVPCFLDYKLPVAWLERAYDFDHDEDSLVFESYDKDRRIAVESTHMKSVAERALCARISWSAYLGIVKRSGTFCIHGDRNKTAFLQGIEGVEIRWRMTSEGDDES